jgi:hypothetical protein
VTSEILWFVVVETPDSALTGSDRGSLFSVVDDAVRDWRTLTGREAHVHGRYEETQWAIVAKELRYRAADCDMQAIRADSRAAADTLRSVGKALRARAAEIEQDG